MANYVKATNFNSKDSLAVGNPLKIVRGSELDSEFNALQTAIATKADTNSPTFTGTPFAPTAAAGNNTTQVATTAFVSTAAAGRLPAGSVTMFAGAAVPSGWLSCNGAAVSRVLYADLFAAVGTTFGVGDGSTTFNLPNFTNRLPVAAGGLYAVGDTGGSKDAVLVSHTHTLGSAGEHSHTIGFRTGFTGVDSSFEAPNHGLGNTGNITTSTQAAHTHTISTDGVSGTDANLPPYMGINFIIRT